MKTHLTLTFLIVWSAWCNAQIADHWEMLVDAQSQWAYFPGNSFPGANWNQKEFNDSSWATGQGGFGYGDNDDNTVIDQIVSIYLRRTFSISDSTQIKQAIVSIDFDDAFIAYLNGVEIARSGITSNPAFDQVADADHEAVMYNGQAPPSFTVSNELLTELISEGENVFAVEVHNVTTRSSDLSAIPYLFMKVDSETTIYNETPSWFEPPFEFTTSNLPIVIIDTEAEIVDEPKTAGWMRIIRNKGAMNYITDTANIYDGNIGIEIRGSYSARLPQTPYGFETQDATGDNNNVKLIGMPKENDWILLPNYNEKTFIRNSLPFKLFREMGHYAPRTRHCEVVVNDSYEGIYILTEKLKRDDKRIDVAKLDDDDNAGDSITGGYIFKIDYFTDSSSWMSNYHPIDRPRANVHFVYHDPKPEELSDEQKLYIQTYVDAYESVLYSDSYDDLETGYHQYIDAESFADYFIIQELSRNVDGYKKSRYFFKDKDSKGGLINSGPVWDFDWAWKNLNDACNIFNMTDGSGWAYKINGTTCNVRPSPAGWMVKLMEDTVFQNIVGTRYHTLRDSFLSDDYIHNYIDSIETMVESAQERHYTRWDILGKKSGAAEVDGYPDSYPGEVDKFRNWVDLRLAWLDNNMPEMKIYEEEEDTTDNVAVHPIEKANIRVFPNPATSFCFVESDREISTLNVVSPTGSIVSTYTDVNRYNIKLNTDKFGSGVYIIQVTHKDESTFIKRLLVH